MITIISPVINTFKVFGYSIHYYSICIFLGIFVSYLLAINLSDCFKRTQKDNLIDFAPLMIFSSIIGARLYYVCLQPEYYLKDIMAVFMIWQGGLSIHGAIIGAVIFGLFYCKINRLNFFAYADIFSLVAPIGQAIGRWGNFFNQEAFGTPVKNAPIGLYIHYNHRPYKYSDYSYFHPAFLYESILDIVLFIILFFIMEKTARKSNDFPSGFVFFNYILLYSVIRAVIEPCRTDTVKYIGLIPFPFIISIIGIIIGILGIVWLKKRIPNA